MIMFGIECFFQTFLAFALFFGWLSAYYYFYEELDEYETFYNNMTKKIIHKVV